MTVDYWHLEGGGQRGAVELTLVKNGVSLCWQTEGTGHQAYRGTSSASALDPWNDYDRDYVSAVARAVAQLLHDAHAESGIPASLADVLDGVELMNELQARNVLQRREGGNEMFASGAVWGGFLYAVAQAFRGAFTKLGMESPDIYLPGIVSYGDESVSSGTGAASWHSMNLWLQGLLLQARAHALEDGTTLDEVFAGVDYHNYHSHGVTDWPCAPRPLVSWMWEVHCVRDLLIACGMTSASVTVIESGMRGEFVAVLGSDGQPALDEAGHFVRLAAPVPTGEKPDFIPIDFDTDDAESAARFQAHEVWRRLVGAYVSGADVQGWHTFMSDPSGAYQLFGLRRDQGLVQSRPGRAVQRLSWFAFARFHELTTTTFGHVHAASLLLPQVDVASLGCSACTVDQVLAIESGSGPLTPGQLFSCLRGMGRGTSVVDDALTPDGWQVMLDAHGYPGGPPYRYEEDLVVVELLLGSAPVTYAYVVLIDPWRNTYEVCVEWRSEGGGGASAARHGPGAGRCA